VPLRSLDFVPSWAGQLQLIRALCQRRGYGDADPVAPNDTPEGRAQNRRVELTLAGSGQ
jgi:hypothetical protein